MNIEIKMDIEELRSLTSTPPVLEGLKLLGISDIAIAEALKISRPQVSNWKKARHKLTKERAEDLCCILECQIKAYEDAYNNELEPYVKKLPKEQRVAGVQRIVILLETAKFLLELQKAANEHL